MSTPVCVPAVYCKETLVILTEDFLESHNKLNILKQLHLIVIPKKVTPLKTSSAPNRWCMLGKIEWPSSCVTHSSDRNLWPGWACFLILSSWWSAVWTTTKGLVCLSALSNPCFHLWRDTPALSGYLGSSRSLKHRSCHSGNTHITWGCYHSCGECVSAHTWKASCWSSSITNPVHVSLWCFPRCHTPQHFYRLYN